MEKDKIIIWKYPRWSGWAKASYAAIINGASMPVYDCRIEDVEKLAIARYGNLPIERR